MNNVASLLTVTKWTCPPAQVRGQVVCFATGFDLGVRKVQHASIANDLEYTKRLAASQPADAHTI